VTAALSEAEKEVKKTFSELAVKAGQKNRWSAEYYRLVLKVRSPE